MKNTSLFLTIVALFSAASVFAVREGGALASIGAGVARGETKAYLAGVHHAKAAEHHGLAAEHHGKAAEHHAKAAKGLEAA